MQLGRDGDRLDASTTSTLFVSPVISEFVYNQFNHRNASAPRVQLDVSFSVVVYRVRTIATT